MPATDYAEMYRKAVEKHDDLQEALLSQRRKTADATNKLAYHQSGMKRANALDSLVRVADGFMFQVGSYMDDGSTNWGVAVISRKELLDALDMGELDALVNARKALAAEASKLQRNDPGKDQESLLSVLRDVHKALGLDPMKGECDAVAEIESLRARAEASELDASIQKAMDEG